MTMSREDIAKKILIDEDALFERLVEQARRIFKLDKSGNMVWIISRDKLTDREKIALVLLAQHLAAEIGIKDSQSISNSVVAEKLKMSSMSVGARMAELRELGVAHQEKVGVHRVILPGIESIIEEVISKFESD